jgi:predicted RNase H-like HicB family nuclease
MNVARGCAACQKALIATTTPVAPRATIWAMLTDYIRAAMLAAHYEPMDDGHDDERFWANIPACRGVWAAGPTIEQVRDELQEVLEDWLLVRMRRGLEIPVIEGIDLNLAVPA